MGDLIGYARVSSRGQSLGVQRDTLTAAGCRKIFEETAAGMVSYFNCTTGKVSHSVKDHTWSARPAAIAGVRFCHQPAV